MASRLEAILFIIALPASIIGRDICPDGCRCEDDKLRASCVRARLEIIPIQLNPEIHHLDLSYNRIASIQHDLQLYANLDTLDLSWNTMHTLGNDNFEWLQRLEILNMSHNAIRHLTKKSLKGLKALRYLDLSDNNITEIDELAFHSSSVLEYLNLSGNSLTSLPNDLFNSTRFIVVLDLSRNSLLEIPSNNLPRIINLVSLNLTSNLIETVPDDSLTAVTSLEYLSLANNLIKTIADTAFRQLRMLTYLNLSENRLTEIPTNALSTLSELSNLTLSRNRFSAIAKQAFSKMSALQYLELCDCRIKMIDAQAFIDNVNLKGISLDGNRQLTELPPKLFYGTWKNLTTVSIRKCHLSTLQPTHLPIDQLTSLRLGGNPFICNCSLQWLWNVIHTEEQRNETLLSLDSNDIICADDEFFHKPLRSLSESSVRCRMSTLYLTLLAGACIAATCLILGLIACVTRARRQKPPAFAPPPNRPELLVYVEPNARSTKSQSRIIVRSEEELYDLPQDKSPAVESESFYEAPYCSPQRASRSITEGVYAVADVTDLRDTPPEVVSLYRIHSPSSPGRLRSHGLSAIFDFEFRPPLPYKKPHIVFV